MLQKAATLARTAPVALVALLVAACAPLGGAMPKRAQRAPVILATTTSTMDSGLLDVLLPAFTAATGYPVKPLAVGTGQALALGRRGEADVLLAHAPAAETELLAAGVVVNRQLVMHNDFVLVGPPADPAGVRGAGRSAVAALQRIAANGHLFLSRGDDSGTHKLELALWQQAGLQPQGSWYQQSGSGMGQTLNIAAEKGGYTLSDRASFLSLQRHLALAVLLDGDPELLNIYHVMQVNPEQFPKVNRDGAAALVAFLVGPEAQALIGRFGSDRFGQPLFVPDAGKSTAELAGKAG